MTDSLFVHAIEIIEAIEQAGYEAYIVGGSVRDYLLQRPIDDIDIATNASIEVIQSIFPAVIPVGLEFGTVIVRYKQTSYEVTTYRNNEKKQIQNLRTDLRLRDFTMNALAMDKQFHIIDYFGGRRDIENKVIRAVSDPYARLREDPLRVLRSLRFCSELGFTIDKKTLLAMKEVVKYIPSVAIERISHEFSRMIQGPYVQKSMDYIDQIDGLQFLPIFRQTDLLRRQCVRIVEPFTHFSEAIAYFHYIYDKITIVQWTNAWRLSNDTKKRALHLYELVKRYERNGIDRWLVYRLRRDDIHSFVSLVNRIFPQHEVSRDAVEKIHSNLPLQSREDLRISGKDIIAQFPNVKRGRWINDLLTQIEYHVVMNKLKNDKKAIKEWIICHPPDKN